MQGASTTNPEAPWIRLPGLYGLVFNLLDIQNYYIILINTTGHYYIGKQVGDIWTTIKDWTYSADLETGFDQQNFIRILKDATSTYSIAFDSTNALNDNEYSFTDSSIASGEYGFLAGIGSGTDESFPNIPVHCRFKYLIP
jgi:hypothetical protein